MKKLAFVFVAGLAMTFASCGNKTEQAPAADTTVVDSTAAVETIDSVATDSVASDSVVADTTAAPVAE